MIIDEDAYLEHYGILRKSGRYPWGSGDDPYQSAGDFLSTVETLRKQGMNEVQIAANLGMTTTQLRARKTIARSEKKQADITQAERLRGKGLSNIAIGEKMGINESSVRALLAPGVKDRNEVLLATSNMLKDQVDKKNYLDVGSGVEHHLGVSRTKLNAAIAVLKEQGYDIHYVKVPQVGTAGQFTTQTVLVKPGTKYSETFRNRADIKTVTDYSEDGGRTFLGIHAPLSVSSSRVAVNYSDKGGAEADGVVYVRRGKDDLSLGKSSYAQVRIAVDGTHYIKGMAMYRDDLPPGVDLVVNVNKKSTGNKLDALKPLKDEPDNPFGATVRQITKVGSDGKRKVTSAMNIVNEEGDWDQWSRSLSSQMLSKQKPSLAKTQLDVVQERKRREFDEIMALTNPAVRKKLLESFADDVDAAAVHLKAAAPRGTSNHVILPINSMKDTEIYAPNYRNGDRVALIRHPHGGIFEIPELTVNNRNAEARKIVGRAKDAVGINHRVAQKMSGADFDGDTVLVIPNRDGRVKSSPSLQGLKGFDPQIYKIPDDSPIPRITPQNKQKQMGVVTNLIADMTIRGANTTELARAVRHSMVVIDAEKHNLNYKQSAIDNGISQLMAKYQDSPRGGASTLITRASSDIRVPMRKPRPAARGGPIDKATGKKVFEETGETYINGKGQVVVKKFKSKKLAETDDANTLSSGTPIEKVYADHSNKLKALANEARKNAVNTKPIPYSSSAKKVYSGEVSSLNSKLRIALRNSPLERQAQVLANETVRLKTQAHPNLDSSQLKRLKAQALAEARARTGAHKQRIDITPSEWKAIQAGAISNNMLSKILNNSDLERIKELATPRTVTTMTSTKLLRARTMANSGYTQAEIAEALGVSLTTLKNSLSE